MSQYNLPSALQSSSEQHQQQQRRRAILLNYEDDVENPLCLCEYYNKRNQRAHMLMCCCNCEAVDQLCSSLICCNVEDSPSTSCVIAAAECGGGSNNSSTSTIASSSSSNSARLLAFVSERRHLVSEALGECADRLRMPCPGGARKISADFFVSLGAIGFYLLLGTSSFLLSLLAIAIVPTLLYMRFFQLRLRQSQAQEATGSNSSSSSSSSSSSRTRRIQLAYYLILNGLVSALFFFNCVLVDELNSDGGDGGGSSVTPYQWISLNALLAASLVTHVYLHCSDPGFVRASSSSSSSASSSDETTSAVAATEANILSSSSDNYCHKCRLKRHSSGTVGHCPACGTCVYGRDHHCFWVDNCIGYLNHKVFVAYLLLLLTLFVYTLTLVSGHLRRMDCKLSVIWYVQPQQATTATVQSPFSCLFDVYYSNGSRALLTLLCVQLVPLVLYLAMLCAQQFFFVGMGLTQHQLFKISQQNVRFSLALFIRHQVTARALLANCARFWLRWRRAEHVRDRAARHLDADRPLLFDDHFV